MNFAEFATKYKVVSSERVNKTTSECCSKNNYFQFSLLILKGHILVFIANISFRGINPGEQPKTMHWGDEEPTDEILTNHWQEFLYTLYGQTHVPNWFDRLQTVIQSQQEPEDELSEEQAREYHRGTLNDLIRTSHSNLIQGNSEQTTDSTHDWHEDKLSILINKFMKCQLGKNQKVNHINSEQYEVVDTV